MIRTFNYPLQPTIQQEASLNGALVCCQQVYNAGLEQRISAYKKQGKTISRFDQQKDLTELRQSESIFNEVAATILRSSLSRLDFAYKSFFKRIKTGKKAGFPRFRSKDRYSSFSFPTPTVKDGRVRVPNIGMIKFKEYRPLRGTLKVAHVRRTAKGWVLSVVCDLGAAPAKREIKTSTGIDVGLTHFATLSNGETVANPRFYRKSEEVLASRQQKLAKKRKGSKARLRAKRLVAKAHEHINNQRLDFLRKTAKFLVGKYDLIAYEDLNIKGMVQSNLGKSISDASWGKFIKCIKNKAEEAGSYAIPVNPRGTTQRCSGCDTVVYKTLPQREHLCNQCGLNLDRDHNAARNIKALGWSAVKQLETTGLTEAYGIL